MTKTIQNPSAAPIPDGQARALSGPHADALRVLMQVNTMDRGGGAEQFAGALHDAAFGRGNRSTFAVGRKFTDRPGIVELPRSPWWRAWNGVAKRFAHRDRIRVAVKALAEPVRVINYLRGAEDFHFPGTHRLLELTEPGPELVHLHNLHGGYFDLRFLPRLSRSVPTVLTLHDAWLLAGHCAHSLDCERWQTGCGQCPYLNLPMRVGRDRTATNWSIKRDIYRRCRLHIATPSRWLMDKVERSILADGVAEARVIPNGVDTGVFHPGDRVAARHELGLPIDSQILLFVGHEAHANPWKDLPTILTAMQALCARRDSTGPPMILLVLGDSKPPKPVPGMQTRGVPQTDDADRIAEYYRAANVYIHAARADTSPLSVLEAMACGTPVVATAVGGIPEQINDQQTGLLVPMGDSRGMAEAVERLLDDPSMRDRLGNAGAEHARKHHDLSGVIDTYFEWYETLLANERQ